MSANTFREVCKRLVKFSILSSHFAVIGEGDDDAEMSYDNSRATHDEDEAQRWAPRHKTPNNKKQNVYELSKRFLAVFLLLLQNLDYPDKSDDRYLTHIF